jgi:hypothetical protein
MIRFYGKKEVGESSMKSTIVVQQRSNGGNHFSYYRPLTRRDRMVEIIFLTIDPLTRPRYVCICKKSETSRSSTEST